MRALDVPISVLLWFTGIDDKRPRQDQLSNLCHRNLLKFIIQDVFRHQANHVDDIFGGTDPWRIT